MRSSLVFFALIATASAAHLNHVPHRSRHSEVAREHAGSQSSNSTGVARRSGKLKRLGRCVAKTPSVGLTSTSQDQSPPAATNVGSNPTSTTKQSSGGSVASGTQAGAAPSATRTSAADPFLESLSEPLNNALEPAFTSTHVGDMTFYAQGQTACGDTYDDRTFTAAIPHAMYDAWSGATAETNRNPCCGPWVKGRYFLSSADVVVPGSSHAVLGGDGLLNCVFGEQCHLPLTATVHNPHTGISLRVWIVDRCGGCTNGDIDLAPAAFLKLTGKDPSSFATSDLLTEALKDPQGRIPNVTWTFDTHQSYGAVQGA